MSCCRRANPVDAVREGFASLRDANPSLTAGLTRADDLTRGGVQPAGRAAAATRAAARRRPSG